jgi:hypothetical protein
MKTFKLRTHDRMMHLRDVLLRVAPHCAYSQAHTLDLSRSGVKIFTQMSIAAGDSVELIWVDRQERVKLAGRVVYVQVDDAGLFAGVRFHEAISAATLRDLNRRREDQASDLRLDPGKDARSGHKRLA